MTSPRRLLVRAVPTVVAAAAALLVVGSLTPASADVPVGWSDPPSVNIAHALLLLGGIPLVLGIIIVALVYAPSLARGERISPVAAPVVDQWLGGPRRGTRELAGPDAETSKAGGARGSW